MVRIAGVQAGTVADELELEIGSRVVRINGETVRDTVDFRFLETDPFLEVEVAGADGSVLYEIEKDAGEPLGVVTAPDAVRQCSNRCVFCFIDGNPAGARRSLHLKDDDFRLSFTYGSYVTLTNLGPRGFQRLIDQRLSPLYVSVHATEPAVRERLLGVARGGEIMRELRTLIDGGIEVHTQVVLCPGWNDGVHLERTIDDLWSLGPGVLSLSVVPVGLTRYNLGRPVRLLMRDEAARAIAHVERARGRALAERGSGWVYAGDEMYFIAGAPVPSASYYDNWPLTENGVGAVRAFLDAFDAGFASLDARSGQRIAVVTGTRMRDLIEPLAARLSAQTVADVRTVTVDNRYFGPTVSTAGLLAGADIRCALAGEESFDAVLLPAESLNDDGRFIDDVSLAQLEAWLDPARIVTGHELTAAFARL